MFTTQQLQAATKIQTTFRRHLDQKKYGVTQFKRAEQAAYKTFAIGNDPVIDKLAPHKSTSGQPIALVATSGLRALRLASELSVAHVVPKVIIIDNSYEVCMFWRGIREVFQEKTGEHEKLEKLKAFFRSNQYLFHVDSNSNSSGSNNYSVESPYRYIHELITKYGFDFISKTILNTTFIKQSWATSGLLAKVGNILQRMGFEDIYAYPSNILGCLKTEADKNSLLANIQSLKPRLSIHTNLCPVHCVPEKVFYLTDQTPSHVRKAVLPASQGSQGLSGAQSMMGGSVQMNSSLLFLMMMGGAQVVRVGPNNISMMVGRDFFSSNSSSLHFSSLGQNDSSDRRGSMGLSFAGIQNMLNKR